MYVEFPTSPEGFEGGEGFDEELSVHNNTYKLLVMESKRRALTMLPEAAATAAVGAVHHPVQSERLVAYVRLGAPPQKKRRRQSGCQPLASLPPGP